MPRVALVLIFILATCREQPRQPVWSALAAEDFSEPFDVIRSGERRQLRDCPSVLAAIHDGFETTQPADYPVLLVTAGRCRARQAIAQAKPFARTFWAESDRLPPEALPGAGWEYKTTLIARGDFDGDGAEDRLYQVDEWASHGTSRRARFLIFTRAAASGAPKLWRDLSN